MAYGLEEAFQDRLLLALDGGRAAGGRAAAQGAVLADPPCLGPRIDDHAGAVEAVHPARRKLAGRAQGEIYDRLLEVQSQLSRGPEGIDKPLSCTASQLAKVAQMRPDDLRGVEQVLGDRRHERFGAAFLDVLEQAG